MGSEVAGAATSRFVLLAAGALAAGALASVWFSQRDESAPLAAPLQEPALLEGGPEPSPAHGVLARDDAARSEPEAGRRTAPPAPDAEPTTSWNRTREDLVEDWYFLDEIRSKLSREAFAAAQGLASERNFMTLTVAAKLHATMAQCLLDGSYLEADVACATVPDPEQLVLDCRLLHLELPRSHHANALPSQVRPAPRILIDLRQHRDLAHDLRELPRHQDPKKSGSTPTLQAIADELLDVGYAVMAR